MLDSATVMNLSFLTSDFWGVLAALFLFRENLQWYYFCAVALVIGGVVIYHLAHHPSPDLHALPVQANPKSSTEEEQQILVEPEPSLFNAPLPTAMCAVDSLGSSLVDESLKSNQ